MAKKDKKKKSTALTKMTFDKATNWGEHLIPKRVKRIKEVVKKVSTKIRTKLKKRADDKAAAQKPMDDYIAKKGLIPTKPMAKSGEMDVELTERIKGNPQGGSITHTKDTSKLSPDKATGGYKAGSAARKAQLETLSKVKTGTSKKTGQPTHRPGRTPVTTVKPPDKWAKQIEKIRNSNMSITQKKNAINEVNKRKESAGMEAGRKARQADVMETEEGQKAYVAKMKRNRELAAKNKKKNKKY